MMWSLLELEQDLLKYHQLRAAWDGFCRLLQIEQYFSCPLCHSSPKIVVCDGLTLSFQKRHRIQASVNSDTKTDMFDGRRYYSQDLFVL